MNFDIRYIDFNKHIANIQLPKLKYYRCFNPSVIKLANNKYLYSVRVNFIESCEKPYDKFIAGNSEQCHNINKYSKGINFWWNRWGENEKCYSYAITVFFVNNYKDNSFKHVTIKNPNLEQYLDEDRYIANNFIMQSDVRLEKINNSLYISESLNPLIKIQYDDNNHEITILSTNYVLGPKSQAKNIQIVKLHDDLNPIYIDWFYYNKGVVFKQNSNIIRVIPFNNDYVLDGQGSHVTNNENDKQKYKLNYGIMPQFSFGTPHIKINHDNNLLLGVGHIKIHSDEITYPYILNSNISKFRSNLHQDMVKYFKDRYKPHYGTTNPPNCHGFIYLLYFYTLNYETNEMFISDSYLPILLDKRTKDSYYDLDYKFGLIFPTGLIKLNKSNILVSCGYGDFYSVNLEFNLSHIVNLCKYDVKNVDLLKYNYYIIGRSQDKTYINTRLENIIHHKKYRYYKNKYLDLKKNAY